MGCLFPETQGVNTVGAWPLTSQGQNMVGFPKARDTCINMWYGDPRTEDAFLGLRAETTFTETDREGQVFLGLWPLCPAPDTCPSLAGGQVGTPRLQPHGPS